MTQPAGLIGVFETPAALMQAASGLRAIGLAAVEAYTPYRLDGLDEMIHPGGRHRGLPLAIAAGGVLGAALGYFFQYWIAALAYPLNVGGRPHHSGPAFIVSACELGLLGAVTAEFFGLWLACRLPLLYHPAFDAAGFDRASTDRFLLSVDCRDPGCDPAAIRQLFERHGAAAIVETA